MKTLRVKLCLSIAMLIFGLVCWLPLPVRLAATTQTMPELIVLDDIEHRNSVFSGDYGKVPFDHEQHVAKDSCVTCHHTNSNKLTIKLEEQVANCATCHKENDSICEIEGTNEDRRFKGRDALNAKDAYHGSVSMIGCVGCHKERQIEPIGCRDCHADKNKIDYKYKINTTTVIPNPMPINPSPVIINNWDDKEWRKRDRQWQDKFQPDSADNNNPENNSWANNQITTFASYGNTELATTTKLLTIGYYNARGSTRMVNTKVDRISSFSIDIDTAAYDIVDSMLRNSQRPHNDIIRTEEFINHFAFDYPEVYHPLSIYTDALVSPFNPERLFLRIALQTRNNATLTHFSFIIDGEILDNNETLMLVQKSLETTINQLNPGETVSIIEAGSVEKLLIGRSSNRALLLNTVNSLKTSSQSNNNSMIKSINLAQEQLKPARQGSKHIVILSDGNSKRANNSYVNHYQNLANGAGGPLISFVGIGKDGYNDQLLERLAARSGGRSYFVDNLADAARVFGELRNYSFITVTDLKNQLEFNSDSVTSYRLLGYEQRDVVDNYLRKDQIDGGRLFGGQTIIALYELEVKKEPGWSLGKLWVRYRGPDDRKVEFSQQLIIDQLKPASTKIMQELKLITSVATFAEVLRDPKKTRYYPPLKIRALMVEAGQHYNNKDALTELLLMFDRAQAFLQ